MENKYFLRQNRELCSKESQNRKLKTEKLDFIFPLSYFVLNHPSGFEDVHEPAQKYFACFFVFHDLRFPSHGHLELL